MIAYYGGKTFEVNSRLIYTFNAASIAVKLITEKQDSFQQKPSTYIKHVDLEQFKFTIPLNVELGINPRQEYEDWKRILESKTPDVFIIGGKPLNPNRYLLTSITCGNLMANVYGDWLSCDLQLQFDEFVRAGADKSGSGKNGAAAGIKIDNPYGATGYSAEEKSALKRESTLGRN